MERGRERDVAIFQHNQIGPQRADGGPTWIHLDLHLPFKYIKKHAKQMCRFHFPSRYLFLISELVVYRRLLRRLDLHLLRGRPVRGVTVGQVAHAGVGELRLLMSVDPKRNGGWGEGSESNGLSHVHHLHAACSSAEGRSLTGK